MESLEEKTCKLCKQKFDPKVEWQKFCSDDCHDKHWQGVYREKAALNKRLEKIEEKLGMK